MKKAFTPYKQTTLANKCSYLLLSKWLDVNLLVSRYVSVDLTSLVHASVPNN